MLHFIIVGVLVFAATYGIYTGLTSVDLMPVQASVQAVEIDWMWNLQLIAMSFLFALIFVPIIYSLFVFRRKTGDKSEGEHFEGNNALEVGWTIIPLFVVVLFSFLGAGNLARTLRTDPDAMVVKVTGFQWGWKFSYPDYGFETKEMYLPVDQQVLLKMESADVIHSFWVPEFRPKQDLVPGRVTELTITPNLVGNYKVRCAELCGTSHAYMENPVVVVEQVKFDAWVEEQKELAAAANTPEAKGKLLVDSNGCVACHSVNGAAGVGPTWLGLFGADVELANGSVVTADDAFLAESIKDPAATVVKGFQPTMPKYPFTDEEIANIVAYIKTIK